MERVQVYEYKVERETPKRWYINKHTYLAKDDPWVFTDPNNMVQKLQELKEKRLAETLLRLRKLKKITAIRIHQVSRGGGILEL